MYLSAVQISYSIGSTDTHRLLLAVIYLLASILIIIFALFMIANGFIVRSGERKSLANSLSLLFGLGIIAYIVLLIAFVLTNSDFAIKHPKLDTLLSITFVVVSVFFLVLMFIFFAFLVYSILYASLPRRRDYDYVIVHGAGLAGGERVTPLLASRIDTVIEALRAGTKPDVKLIASGGQGPDEKISEAEAITRYALERGVHPDQILAEDQSHTTWQNLRMSPGNRRGRLGEDATQIPLRHEQLPRAPNVVLRAEARTGRRGTGLEDGRLLHSHRVRPRVRRDPSPSSRSPLAALTFLLLAFIIASFVMG